MTGADARKEPAIVLQAQPVPEVKPAGVPTTLRKQHPGSAIWIRLAVILIAGAIAALFVTRWDVWVGSRVRQTTDDAYVRGDITPWALAASLPLILLLRPPPPNPLTPPHLPAAH